MKNERLVIIGLIITIVIGLTSVCFESYFKQQTKQREYDIIVAKENTKQDSLKLLQYKYLSKQAAILESYEQANKLRNNK